MLYLYILSAWLVVVGTWRVSQAMTASPSIADIFWAKEYNWLTNLIRLHRDIILWLLGIKRSKRCEPDTVSGSIHPRELSYGLRWLITGLLLQLILQICNVVSSD